LDRTRGVVFVVRRRESMSLDEVSSVRFPQPRAVQLHR
jgi:hypothetical protein